MGYKKTISNTKDETQTRINLIMKKLVLVIFVLFFSSCIGTKIKKLEGQTKTEMLNTLGYPNQIISKENDIKIYVYFYEDYSVNNYPSIIGLMYLNPEEKIIFVEKERTTLKLKQYLQNKNLY